MIGETQALFTSSRVARKLGRSRQSVSRQLSGVPASGQLVVNGVAVAAWRMEDLPLTLCQQIEAEAERQGYRSAEAFMSAEEQRWEPRVPFTQVSQEDQTKAANLQRALAPSLARLSNVSEWPTGLLEKQGVKDYAAVFGAKNAISIRYFRKLLKRTIERAGAGESFQRLEIYLDENAKRRVSSLPGLSENTEKEFEPLHALISSFTMPCAPSSAEKAVLWKTAFELLEECVTEGRHAKKLKRGLLKFLWRHAPSFY
jgi:hypothetical protein